MLSLEPFSHPTLSCREVFINNVVSFEFETSTMPVLGRGFKATSGGNTLKLENAFLVEHLLPSD